MPTPKPVMTQLQSPKPAKANNLGKVDRGSNLGKFLHVKKSGK